MTHVNSLLSKVASRFAREREITPGLGLKSLEGQWDVQPKAPTFKSTLIVWKHERLVITRALGDSARLERGANQINDELADFIDITIIISGSLRATQRQRDVSASAGQALALACNEPYVAHSSDGTESFSYYVPRSLLESRGVDTNVLVTTVWDLPPVALALRHLALWALQANAHNMPYEKDAVERALHELVLGVVREFNSGFVVSSANADKTRSAILDCIERGYQDAGFDAGVLANELSISKRQMYRLFEGRDTSISQIIKNRRLDHAETLLSSSPHLTLGEVGALSGFKSAEQLSKSFKKRRGNTPSSVR